MGVVSFIQCLATALRPSCVVLKRWVQLGGSRNKETSYNKSKQLNIVDSFTKLDFGINVCSVQQHLCNVNMLYVVSEHKL